MSPTPPLTQFIGRTERTLRALMDLVLAETGGTFHQWVALNLAPLNGDSIDRTQLVAGLANALQIDDAVAEATIAEMADDGLLRTASASAVALSDGGRERYTRIRTAVDQITAPLYGDLPPHDVAAARRVLTTISDRADTMLARF
jgi:hypothetical protein